MDIVKALQTHASELETELSKTRRAIGALSGPTAKRRIGTSVSGGSGSYKRTAATRRKLSVRMKRMWARRKAGK